MKEQDIMTVDDACKILKITRMTLYNWRKKGTAPRIVKIGKNRILIMRQDLEDFMESRGCKRAA